MVELCQCLRGKAPSNLNWMAVLELANKTLTTPFLIDLVDRPDQSVPEDVKVFVREIYRRNALRNDLLRAQLEEAVAALNERDVIPVLLKGSAILATAAPECRATRIMADLDILVDPDQMETALQALAELDYQSHFRAPPESKKQYSDLKRPRDVGMIDLHQAAPGPDYFYRSSGKLLEHCMSVSVGRGTAYLPTTTFQAYMLIIHDQFQDNDYWVGEVDVRHLVELRDLANSSDGIDWKRLMSFAPGRLTRNAIAKQLVALAELLGVDVPVGLRKEPIPRLQFRRLLLQSRFPLARWPLLSVALLDYGNYRRELGADYQTDTRRNATLTLPRVHTLRHLAGLVGNHRIGKV
ncbi:nucleotidyltransferase family protein [Bradyrhizobium sp. RDI18]|uniref:nucleotidyltransferase family protein n=1 Tax=Bradyrhizobium sp. RDI18 TaxID=3367400 RepID=UPI0037239736